MKHIAFFLSLFVFNGSLLAQSTEGNNVDNAAKETLQKANNPLADMTALNFQNYYIPKLSDAPGESYLNNTWIRFATPIAAGKFLLRVSLPFNTIGLPDGNGFVNSTNGLGDVNAFLSYNFISKPAKTIGVGPLLAVPTATETALGTGKWQGGLAFVAFIANSPILPGKPLLQVIPTETERTWGLFNLFTFGS
jgi:hypothetical protein